LLFLLSKDPSKWLGSGDLDAEEIKNHPWFSEINWHEAMKWKLVVPKVNKRETLEDLEFDIGSNLIPADRKQMWKHMNEVEVMVADWSFLVTGDIPE